MATILDRETVAEARACFPGPVVPCRDIDPRAYERWVRGMALWAFRHGTVLLAAAEIDHADERIE